MKTKATSMKDKFSKYWDGLENINKLLIIASVFYPRKMMKFATLCFEILYGKGCSKSKELLKTVSDVMENLFDEYNLTYKSRIERFSAKKWSASQVGSVNKNHDADEIVDKVIVGAYETMDVVYSQLVNEEGCDDTSNELSIYLSENVENPKANNLKTNYDVLSWWRVNTPKILVLSELARDLLAMQVSSVASEACCSTSGCIVSPQRSYLTHYMIEVLMCTKQ